MPHLKLVLFCLSLLPLILGIVLFNHGQGFDNDDAFIIFLAEALIGFLLINLFFYFNSYLMSFVLSLGLYVILYFVFTADPNGDEFAVWISLLIYPVLVAVLCLIFACYKFFNFLKSRNRAGE